MSSAADLFHLDLLPPHCSVHAQIEPTRVRFRAQTGIANLGEAVTLSAWSGWFDVTECPVDLTWAAFDFESVT